MTPLQLWQTLLAFENSIYQVRRLPITFLQRECYKIADEPDEVRRVFNMVGDNDNVCAFTSDVCCVNGADLNHASVRQLIKGSYRLANGA